MDIYPVKLYNLWDILIVYNTLVPRS